jgi:hypothetical protein
LLSVFGVLLIDEAGTVLAFLLTDAETFLAVDLTTLAVFVATLLALYALTALLVPLITAFAAFVTNPPPGIKLEAILKAAPAFWYHFVFLLVSVRISSPIAKL